MRVYVIEHKEAFGGFVPVFVTYRKRDLLREWANDPPLGSPVRTRRWYVLNRPPIEPKPKQRAAESAKERR